MSTFTQSNTSKNTCVITNGDSHLGFALASRILLAIQKNEQSETTGNRVRVLYRENEGYDLSKLEELGAELMRVDYNNEKEMQKAVKDARFVALIPEHSTERLKQAENLIKAARDAKVEFVTLFSIVGVDRLNESSALAQKSNEFRNLKQYSQIEKCVEKDFKDKCSIIRSALFYQTMYYVAPIMEGKNRYPTVVKKNKEWVTVCINDVVAGFWERAKKYHETDVSHNRVWNFVGHKPMTPEQMCQKIGQGLGRNDLTIQEMNETQFREELKKIKSDNRFNHRPNTGNDFHRGHDGFWSFPIGRYLNNESIETALEYMRLANEGHLQIDSQDLEKALGSKPTDLKAYFENNRDSFKQFE